MALDEFLTILTRIVFSLLALVTLTQALRHRDRTRFDIAAVFVSLAMTVVIQGIEGIIGFEIPWLEKVGTLAVMAHPYFLLRIAHYFYPVPTLIRRGALLGLAIAGIGLITSGPEAPAAVTLLLIVYFVFVEAYAAVLFFRGTISFAGITRQRLRLASIGSGLLAGLILLAGILIALPAGNLLAPLIQVLAISAGVSYYLGFSPPRWLRQAWQLSELHQYLRETSGHWAQKRPNIYNHLSTSAEFMTGGIKAVIAAWDFEQHCLKIDAPGPSPWTAERLEAQPGVLAKVWRDRKPRMAADPDEIGLEAAQWSRSLGAQSLLIVPVASPSRAWGLLIVALRHAPLFLEDDLELLTLIAGQSAVLLDYTRLLEEFRLSNQTLEERVAQRTTELENTNRDLQSSEERYRNTLDTMLEGAQIIGFDWRYLYVNEMAAKQGWVTKDNLLGYTMMEKYPGIENTAMFTALQRCMDERVPQRMENELTYPDGAKAWFELNIHPVPEGIFILSMDISARKQAEEALRYSEVRLSAIIEQSPLSIQVFSPNGIAVQANQAWEKLWGSRREQLIGYNILTDPQVKAGDILPYIEKAFAGEVVVIPPVYYDPAEIGRVGKARWTTAVMYPIKDSSGRIREVVLTHEDVTDRKEAEQILQKAHAELEFRVKERTAALSEANAFLQTMMDNMPDHIYFKDADSRFIRNSRSQARLMGLSDPAQVVGKTDFDFFPIEHAQQSYDEEQEVIRSGRPLMNIEERVVWPDGHVSWVSTTKLPLRDAKGDVIGTFGISREITARKQAEEALQNSNTQLEAANKELEAFSYSVSHDLRAPLRSIDGFSQALLEDYGDQIPAEGRGYLERARAAAQRMAELIDDLLALSRVTRAPLERRSVDLSALAQGIATDLQREHPHRRVTISIRPGMVVEGDRNLLHIALQNLLSNAWKFTTKTKSARIEFGEENGAGARIFYIRDNGSGFDMNYVDKLFGAFQRLHSADDFPGTGIGLATVQRILHKHGGRAWAEGAVNQGATFYFTL